MKKRIIEIIVAGFVCAATLATALAGMGTVNVTSSETSVLAANARRRWVILQNNSTNDIYVKVDSSATTLTIGDGIKLVPGASLAISGNGQANAAINAIKGIVASGSAFLTYQEGNEN